MISTVCEFAHTAHTAHIPDSVTSLSRAYVTMPEFLTYILYIDHSIQMHAHRGLCAHCAHCAQVVKCANLLGFKHASDVRKSVR